MVPSKYYKVLGDKDHGGFWKQTAIAIALIVAEAFVCKTLRFISIVSNSFACYRNIEVTSR